MRREAGQGFEPARGEDENGAGVARGSAAGSGGGVAQGGGEVRGGAGAGPVGRRGTRPEEVAEGGQEGGGEGRGVPVGVNAF